MVLTGAMGEAQAAPPELVTMLQDVTKADGAQYQADDGLVGMDTAKIIASPGPAGGYLAVYHHLLGGDFQVRLAESDNLLDWTYVTTLENRASQPTVAALSDNGFLVAYEKEGSATSCRGSGSCLGFKHYRSLADLRGNVHDRAVTVNRTLSSCNEGTPNIYAATLNPDLSHSIINVGFHYFQGCDVDRQAVGTLTNFSSWKTQADANLNTLFTNLGTIKGNVGDRDGFFYQGRPYSLVEAQSSKGDFRTWRPYLFDRTANSLTPLTLVTHQRSGSFGNPTYTDIVLPDGSRGFVATQFLFSEAAGEKEAGQLIYYKRYPVQPDQDDIDSPAVAITQPANGARVDRYSTVTIKASASDNVAVAKVAFYVNGALKCVSPFAPYACSWTVPGGSGVSYTIEARAFDLSSLTSSSRVTVRSR